MRTNSVSPLTWLEGFIPCAEDWHTKLNLLQVVPLPSQFFFVCLYLSPKYLCIIGHLEVLHEKIYLYIVCIYSLIYLFIIEVYNFFFLCLLSFVFSLIWSFSYKCRYVYV